MNIYSFTTLAYIEDLYLELGEAFDVCEVTPIKTAIRNDDSIVVMADAYKCTVTVYCEAGHKQERALERLAERYAKMYGQDYVLVTKSEGELL